MWRSYTGFSLLIFFALTSLAFGQEFTGNINGRVAELQALSCRVSRSPSPVQLYRVRDR